MSDNLSADERAAFFRAAKAKQDEMLIVRRNFSEPSKATERQPAWLTLLQSKQKAAEQQTLHNAWTTVLEKHCEAHQRENAKRGQQAAEFNAGWLRQLRRESGNGDEL